MRLFLARWFPAFSRIEIEGRIVLDAYLGVSLFFLLLWIPLPLATTYALAAVLVLAVAYLSYRVATEVPDIPRWGKDRALALSRAALLPSLAIAFGVLILESWVALTQPAGNTLDGANATLWTANLLFHGHFSPSLAPFVDYPVFSPQGITVWFAASHLLLGIPLWSSANETAPVFQALTVLGAAYLGRRWFGGRAIPIAFAAASALIFSWPRLLIQGTYDFVAVFPLMYLLVAWLPETFLEREVDPARSGVLVPLLLVGAISVFFSPVPGEVLIPGLLVSLLLGAVVSRGLWAQLLGRLHRWGLLLLAFVVGASPSLAVISMNRNLAVQGVPPVVLTPADLNALLNPFVFGEGNLWIAPNWALHLEWALLLLSAIALLVLRPQWMADLSRGSTRLFLGALPFLLGAPLLIGVANGWPQSPLHAITNLSETALVFVAGESLLCLLPVAAVVGHLRFPRTTVAVRARTRSRSMTVFLVVLLIAASAVPLVEVAAVLPGDMAQSAHIVSNVTSDDISAMEFLAEEPRGAVLVAPGSGGQFLPAFTSDPVIFPLVGIGGGVGFLAGNLGGPVGVPFEGPASNTTYRSIVSQLTFGNFTSSLPGEIATLNLRYVLVTGASTTLFSPFLPGPLLSDPSEFSLLYEKGDAYVFAVVGYPSLS